MRSWRFIAALVVAVAVVAAAFHFAKPLPDTHFDETFLPKSSYVRYVAAGHDNAAAGLFWIMGLTDLGESYFTGKEYNYLSHVAEICTDLDSLFYTPYYFVGALTPQDATDTSDYKVMRKAVRIFPNDWRMALGFSLRLAMGAYPDKKAAADIMRPYLTSPDSTIPPHIRTIHRIFELDAMPTEVALEAALNDVLQPNFKKFRKSFYGKIYRLLGYRNLIMDPDSDEIYQAIKKTVDDMADEKISFQQAYFYLMSRRAPAENLAAESSSVENASAENSSAPKTAGEKKFDENHSAENPPAENVSSEISTKI